MPSFGRRSLSRLATVDPRLQAVCHAVIPYFDFTVLCGHRREALQNLAYKTGQSKLQWPNSKHNRTPSLAVDIAPYQKQVKGGVDWKDLARFYYLAGRILQAAIDLDIGLRWGGQWDWTTPYNGAAAFYITQGYAHQRVPFYQSQEDRAFWKWSKEAKPAPGLFMDGPHIELVE